MRDWLKNVLLQLYEHDSMSHDFLTPKQRFRVRCAAHMGKILQTVPNQSVNEWVRQTGVQHPWEKKNACTGNKTVGFCSSRWRKSLRVRDVCMLGITLLSCSHRTLRRTTTCTSTQCTGSLLNWTNTPLTGIFYSSVLTLNWHSKVFGIHFHWFISMKPICQIHWIFLLMATEVPVIHYPMKLTFFTEVEP